MTLLGQFALWVGLLAGLWSAGIAFSGRWRDRPELGASAIRGSYALALAMIVAALALWKGLITHDFNIEYVASYTSRNLPTSYIMTAFWAGQKGSLLFWALVLSIFGAVAQLVTGRRHEDLLPYVAGITGAVAVFFILAMLFAANPFDRLAFTPQGRCGSRGSRLCWSNIFRPPSLSCCAIRWS